MSIDLEVEPPLIPQVVVVEAPASVVVVEAPDLAVAVGPLPVQFLAPPTAVGLVVPVAGGAGPPGPVGPPGPPSGTYIHDQTIPAAVWTIEHGLGYDPGGVVIITSDGWLASEWGLQYLQPGQSLRLSFDIPIAGSASLS